MASSSSSSSSSVRWLYDVFLSFRGEETRKSFTDHLYDDLSQAGINTFRDDEEIRKGENISAELLKAIEGSKVSIIIFSKTYARSSWCLDELVKILECKKNLQQVVLPIFYNVDPSDVRKQKGEFGDALIQHRERFEDKKVDEWKDALTTVADLSGWDLQTMANGYEAKFIKKITEEVQKKVNCIDINVAKYPVGIDSRVRDILRLLQSQTNYGVKMVGIFGMGGVGKTTLAKAVYNNLSTQSFEGSCFIANIKSKVSEVHNGLVRLQEKLLQKTLKGIKFEIDNVDEGISLIKARLESKRVLIVLDDINHISQLESLAGQQNWFGSGSTIIITTRDTHLLSDLEKYEVRTLSSDESLQLLSWHAFGAPIPSKEYNELSERIARYTCGLPLALTIIGSHLHGRSVQEWMQNAEKLKRIPHDDVKKILKISYDGLGGDAQNIFLDIAHFFIGHDQNDVTIILEACGFSYAKSEIITLRERCLLTSIGEGGFARIYMHDLIRDMGREIVRNESVQEPGRRSRLIDPEDVRNVLENNKGTEVIEGMVVNSDMFKNVPLSTKVFKMMVNLRVLILDGVCLKGSFKYMPNELRLFRLHNCHLSHISSNFHMGKLVELDLEGSNIKEFQPNMQHFRCLRILKFDGCKQLKKTPDFNGVQSLQRVSFRGCSNLVKVYPSIGSLERLVVLSFGCCKKLKELPSNICKLKSLEVLYLYGCYELKELPTELGKLEQLRNLHAEETAISQLPFSFGCLRNIESLCLGKHEGSLVPSKSKSKLHDTPHLWSRKTCDSVGLFPSSVVNLCSLKRLSVNINNLREVDLPIVLESVSSLTHLKLNGGSYLQSLPFNLCYLSNLESLNLDNWKNLRELLQLPPSLVKLSTENCISLEKITGISKLKKLKKLYMRNCKRLVDLPGLESIESLEKLDITNCNALTIPSNYLHKVNLPITLGTSSSLTYSDINRSLYLQNLQFSHCHLFNLKWLWLNDLRNLRILVELPPSLQYLWARNCVSLESIDISNLKRLEQLSIPNCKSLVELQGWERLESLYELEITNCSALRTPSIEKWFQAHSHHGNTVQIELCVFEDCVACYIRKLLTHKYLKIGYSGIDGNELSGIGVSVRSKRSGAWIHNVKEPQYYIQIKKYETKKFEVAITKIGEVLEVYAHFLPMQKILCLLEIHRNREGEVRFFPSTTGFIPPN